MLKRTLCLAWLCLCLVARPGYTQNRIIDLNISLKMEAVSNTDMAIPVNPGGQQEVSVKVVRPDGSAMPGADIEFTITSGPAIAGFPVAATTDANGIAAIQVPTDTPGAYVIEANPTAANPEVDQDTPQVFDLYIVEVTIPLVNRSIDPDITMSSTVSQGIPPRVETTVAVTINPDLTGSAHSIHFEVVSTGPVSGQAHISANQTRVNSGNITVKGTGPGGNPVVQTDPTIGLPLLPHIRATIDGGDECGLSQPFSICAHPKNFHEVGHAPLSLGKIGYDYEWVSDSNFNTSDLDQVLVGEHVEYTNAGVFYPPNPPFDWGGSQDPFARTTTPGTNTDNGGTSSFLGDTHYNNYLPSDCMHPGPYATFDATQHYIFRCNRCMPAGSSSVPTDYFQFVNYGSITMSRTISLTGGAWEYEIIKSGGSTSTESNTRPIPAGGVCGQ